MKNKIVGYIIIGFSIVIGIIVYLFNRALTKIVDTSCSHGIECPMWGTIDFHTNIAIGIMVFIILIGLYLIFKKEEKEIIIKTKIKKVEKAEPKKDFSRIINRLNQEEKVILKTIQESDGSIFQSDLVEKTSMNKVKVTRILDRLEGLNVIERKRRGMTNMVILKR